jgi:hypothetical protein
MLHVIKAAVVVRAFYIEIERPCASIAAERRGWSASDVTRRDEGRPESFVAEGRFVPVPSLEHAAIFDVQHRHFQDARTRAALTDRVDGLGRISVPPVGRAEASGHLLKLFRRVAGRPDRDFRIVLAVRDMNPVSDDLYDRRKRLVVVDIGFRHFQRNEAAIEINVEMRARVPERDAIHKAVADKYVDAVRPSRIVHLEPWAHPSGELREANEVTLIAKAVKNGLVVCNVFALGPWHDARIIDHFLINQGKGAHIFRPICRNGPRI